MPNFMGQVVLVADEITGLSVGPMPFRKDLEKSEPQTVAQLVAAIRAIGGTVVHYNSPRDLAEKAREHQGAVVLSIFGGEASRNRMALVPAICETYGLTCIGPDVYGRIIAQDKEVSKRLARDVELSTPPWKVIRSEGDISSLAKMTYPCVVKPLMEGSSIGISQVNLVRTSNAAAQLTQKLLSGLGQPVLVEGFVAGREVAFVAIEKGQTMHTAFCEVIVQDRPDFFQQVLFDAEEKVNPTTGRTVINIDSELCEQDRHALLAFLRAFGSFGYCRVDGRLVDGRFHFLEMTPDAWIDPLGQFAMGFTEIGWTYEQVIGAVLASAGTTPPDQ